MKPTQLPYLLVPLALMACQKAPDQAVAEHVTPKLETDAQIYSYGAGYQLGSRLASGPIDLDADGLTAGIKDALAGNEPAIEEQRLQEVAERVQQEMMAKHKAEIEELSGKNAAESAAFFAANAEKANVVTLESGVQYRIIESAEGETPSATDTVVVNYQGRLLDGTEFDSSYVRGEPAQVAINTAIPGWREALPLMPVGSKWEIFVPPELAYGDSGQGPIPPNAALVFEVELIGITPPATVAEEAEND